MGEVSFFGFDRGAMKERANTVAAFVPGYVEDLEDLEDFEPEGVTQIDNSQKARREEELPEAGKRTTEREEKELKAKEEKQELKEKEEKELREKEEKVLKAKEEAERKLKERKEEGQRSAKEKEEEALRKCTTSERDERESQVGGKEDESQSVVETQSASEKPTFPLNSSEMEQLQVTIHGAKNLPKKGMLGQCNPYVVLIVEDQRIRSAAIRKSFNPGWNF